MPKHVLLRTPSVGGRGGSPFQHTDPDGLPLLGIDFRKRVSLNRFTSVFRPAARVGDRIVRVAGRQGYVVGGMNAWSNGRFVGGIQLIFMRMNKGRLSTTDQYTTDWIGQPPEGGAGVQRLAGDGRVVLGIYGREGATIDAIGLIVAQ